MKTGKNNGSNEGLKKLLIDQLNDIYWAEKALVKEMPKMSKKVTDDGLLKVLGSHLSETKQQVNRLEEVFKLLSVSGGGEKCPGMAGIIDEAESMVSENKDGATRDAAVISALQKVEHYEIATYGTLVAFAKKLDMREVSELLKQTLDEERNADKQLTELAESNINEEALAEMGTEDNR